MISDEYRKLGMDRSITRRDFMNGVAIGVTGASAAFRSLSAFAADPEPQPQLGASLEGEDASDYPPLRHGLRGNFPTAVDIFDPIRDGKYVQFPVADADITEEYDLVVVGAGISGLSAAYFYRMGLALEVQDPDPREPRRFRRPRQARTNFTIRERPTWATAGR